MQGWVIGGACLLAFLSSIGRCEEIGDSKQLEESNPTKTPELSAERLATDDLKIGDSSTPLESSKNLSSSDVLGQVNSEAIKSKDTSKEVKSKSKENLTQPLAKTAEENVGKVSKLTPDGSANLNVYPNAKEPNIQRHSVSIEHNNDIYKSGLNILPPSYTAHLAANSNKAVPAGTPFSPLFSREDPKINLGQAGSGILPYISNAAFEESRRELKPDGIQTRDVDVNDYSETMNAYPYSAPSSKLDNSGESNELRSGLPHVPSYPLQQNIGTNSAHAYADAQVQSFNDKLTLSNQGSDPYSFGYPPTNVLAHTSATGISSAQSSATVIEDAKSRVIWPNELIFPSKIPGAENAIQCTRENEMYHFWSTSFECLVCICLNVYGLLEPLCAKCSGCRAPKPPEPLLPTPDSFVPLPISDPYLPVPLPNTDPYAPPASVPSLILDSTSGQDIPTTTLPVREVPATCSPLPTEVPFTNPLHPCQICICKEAITPLGKIDVKIQCQDNNDCVLPVDVTPLPVIPDIPVPVPLPHCDKFPPNVPFPHPSDKCKLCKCSLEVSSEGLSEPQITCFHNTDCVHKVEVTSEPITPPAPPIPIPVEPYPGPVPQPVLEPIPENLPPEPVIPIAVTPEVPIPWPPISTPAPPLVPLLPTKGPLPGPSPHESCRPYPPNQPFQHPWDECQVCQCSETNGIGVVNVEISCYTKLSCCVEAPEHVVSAVAEASSGSNILGNPAVGYVPVNGLPVNTIKPPQLINTYNSIGSLNQGYAGATAVAENSGLLSDGAIQGHAFAEANAIAQNTDTYNPGSTPHHGVKANAIAQNSADYNLLIPQNQEYTAANAVVQNLGYNVPNQGIAEASAITQNNINSLSNPLSGSNQFAKATGNVIGGGKPLATSNMEYGTIGSYNPGISQSQGYAGANALSQNSMLNPLYPGSYLSANAFSNVNGGQTSADATAEYNSLSALGPPNSEISQNQAYVEANAAAQSLLNNSPQQPPGSYTNAIGSINNVETNEEFIPVSATYKPPLPSQYVSGSPQNQAYLDSIIKNNRLKSTTYKPPTSYDLFNTDISQNQAYAIAKALYNNPITSTYKPPSLYQYDTDILQNQAFAQANAQYNGLVTSTRKPASLYGEYNSAVPQNQVHATANALYNGALSLTDKPPVLYNPYNTRRPPTQTYSEANAVAQNSLPNEGYYLSGPYQTASALGSASGGDQSLAIAEAIAQSQDYSPYLQPEPKLGPNLLINNSPGYPYPSKYYYQNQQYPPYINKADKGLNGQFKTSPVKYAGNYEFNGQPDAINILSSQNGFNPYSSAYSQNAPSSLYSSAYPKPSIYEISPVYRPAHYGGSSVISAAEAYASAQSQRKSGEGFEEEHVDST